MHSILAFHIADKAAFDAGTPLLRAAIAGALCNAVELLATPRHAGLLLRLWLMAGVTLTSA